MPKWLKFIIAILLLPICLSTAITFARVLNGAGRAETTWVPLLAGAACWLVVFLMLPKPMWVYVVGHEMTHAVWTWLFGGRVKKFKASSSGGHVVVTKHNFLVGLAPYFFPFYAALIVAIFIIGHLIWGWLPYRVWFHFLLGAAYTFHLTLTFHILQTRQTDITQQGYLFSSVVIFLGNAWVLLISIPLLASHIRLPTVFSWWFHDIGNLIQRAASLRF